MEWRYAKNAEQVGPVSEQTLVELFKNRELPPDTLVWNETLTEWTPATQFSIFTEDHIERPRRRALPTVILIIAGIVISLAFFLWRLLEIRPTSVRSIETLFASSMASPRDACQNNLKQLGLVLKMFAGENKGSFPALDPRSGYLMFVVDAIFPNYLSDPTILICPADEARAGILTLALNSRQTMTRDHAKKFFDESSYWYLGYATSTEEEGLAFIDAYKTLVKPGAESPEHGFPMVSTDGRTVHELRDGIERFYITDINNPAASGMAQSTIPVIVERPGIHEGGANVLYMDGHVEFVPYPGKYPMTERFISALTALAEAPEPVEYRGSLAGHIVTPNQQPVPGVTVELFQVADAPLDNRKLADMLPLRECPKRQTVTDAQGAFRFDDLPAGHYGIRAVTETDLATDDMPMRVVTGKDGPGSFVATSAARRMDMSPELRPAEPLAGRVITGNGQPVVGAEIYPVSQEAGTRPVSVPESYMLGQKSGNDGVFHFPKLKKGRWQFAVSVNGQQPVVTDWLATGDRDVEIRLGESVPGQALDFVAKTLDGDLFRLSALRGRHVLLDFWATWCGPCRAEMPNVKAVFEEYKNDPRLVLVGMDLDSDAEDVKRYISTNGMGWTQVFLGDWSRTTVPSQYGVRGIPCLILLDPEGRELARDLRGPAIGETLHKFLGAPGSSAAVDGLAAPPAPLAPREDGEVTSEDERKVSVEWIIDPANGHEYCLIKASIEWVINPANGHEYCLVPVMSWPDAQAAAERAGGNLVTINDADENSWLTSTFGSTGCWIGLNDVASEGNFVWASGEIAAYRNWAPGEPNNNGDSSGDQDCAIINYAQPGQWDDQHSTNTNAGIIERIRGVKGNQGQPPVN